MQRSLHTNAVKTFRFRLNACGYFFFLVREKTELLNYTLDFVIKSDTKMDTCEDKYGAWR